jgi:hypothetical protein
MMRFFWFYWDDPKGSIIRGAILLILGVVLVIPMWVVGSIFDFFSVITNGLLGIITFGSLAILLGILTLALGVAAWLFGFIRR